MLNALGQPLISISHHLTGAEKLIRRLLLTIPADGQKQIYQAGWQCIRPSGLDSSAVTILAAALFAAGLNDTQGDPFMVYILIPACLVLMGLMWLFNTTYRVDLLPDGVKLYIPLRRRFFRWQDIRDISIGGEPEQVPGQAVNINNSTIILQVPLGTTGTNSESMKLLPPQMLEDNHICIPINGFGPVPAALFQALHRNWNTANQQDSFTN